MVAGAFTGTKNRIFMSYSLGVVVVYVLSNVVVLVGVVVVVEGARLCV